VGEECLQPPKEGALKVYLLYIVVLSFSKEAEMMMSRMLDVVMSSLFSLLLLLINASRIKVIGLAHDFFVVSRKYLVSNKHRFSALHGGVLCGCLLYGLKRGFIAVCCHPNPPINFGGELNDFY
jgi:hypothetical protein